LGDARHDEAADHFTAAVNSDAFSSKNIHLIYDDFVVVRQDDAYLMLFITECFVQLFGWDGPPLLLTTHQKRCQAFISAGKTDEALEAHKNMMDAIDESAKASCLDWSNGKFSVTLLAAYHTYPHFIQNSRNDVTLWQRIMTAFSVYIPPFLNYFGTDLYAGGDPGARTSWLQCRTQFLPRNASSACNSRSFFFSLSHHSLQHSQNSRPQPQQHHRRLTKLRLTLTRSPHSAPPPVPPTTLPPITTTNTFKTHLQHIFARPPHHAMPPVVDVPFAKGKEVRPVDFTITVSWMSDDDLQRNAAAGARGQDPDIVPDEDYEDLDTTQQDPNMQPQPQAVSVHVDPGEHGGGKSCVCC
jgi:hypothetical protein